MAAASVPPMLPAQFGRYRILRQLGKGGMGAVYLAHDIQLDRPVALKVPHITAEDGPGALQRFHREARAVAALDHPNLCRVYDVGTQDDIPYLTMAYVEGRTLAEVIQGGKQLPQAEAADIVHKIALAMQEAHAKGIVHRDLKPANVMINQRGEPVVMDFGLARLANRNTTRLTRLGAMMGTPSYMPPEQVRGDVAAIGPGCDIYSLGVILYQLLTGHVPFEGPLDVVLGQILAQPPPPMSSYRLDLDPRIEAVCLRALQKEIASRYASMAELAEALTTSRPPPAPPTARRAVQATRIEASAPPVASPLQATMIETRGGLAAQAASQEATVIGPARGAGVARKLKRTPRRLRPRHWVGVGAVTLGTLVLSVGVVALVVSGRGGLVVEQPSPARPKPPADEYRAYMARGQAALTQERFAEAEAAFAQAAKLRPQEGTADNLLQQARQQRQKAEAKLQEKQAAAQRAKRTTELLADAQTALVEGNFAEARRRLDEARKLDPAAKDLTPALAQLEQAEQQREKVKGAYDAAMQAGDAALADKQFKKAVDQYDIAIRAIADADPTLAKQSDPAGWLSMAEKAKAAAEMRRDAVPVPPVPAAADDTLIREMKFVHVPKGTFWMGWDSGKKQSRQVTIAQDFELAAYTVTQAQWEAVMGNNPGYYSRQGGGKEAVKNVSDAELKRFPVETVSWDDVQIFLKKLNEREKGKGWKYRLPREAEWEYACRGAATSKKECSFDFYFAKGTNNLSWDQANFDGRFPGGNGAKGKNLGRTTQVGQYQPNRLGLYDMQGNVWQWCEDLYGAKGPVRVIRGSGDRAGQDCRAALRGGNSPSYRRSQLGFRVSRVPSGG